MKYKVGDKVRVRKDLEVGRRYFMERGSFGDTFTDSMKDFLGKVVTIESADGKYRIKGDYHNWTDTMFEPVCEQKIVITTDGSETLARLYDGNEVIKIATVKCAPDDTFDFATGAKLAFERLMEEEKKQEKIEEEPKCTKKNIKFKDGDYAKITACKHGHHFPIDTIVKLRKTDGDYKAISNCDYWFVLDDELSPVPYLFSGCHYGNIGEETNYRDAIGRPLYVGDVVELFDNKFAKHEDTIIVKKPIEHRNGLVKAFVMGIESDCNDKKGTIECWKILKKRSYDEVKNGERIRGIKYVKEI